MEKFFIHSFRLKVEEKKNQYFFYGATFYTLEKKLYNKHPKEDVVVKDKAVEGWVEYEQETRWYQQVNVGPCSGEWTYIGSTYERWSEYEPDNVYDPQWTDPGFVESGGGGYYEMPPIYVQLNNPIISPQSSLTTKQQNLLVNCIVRISEESCFTKQLYDNLLGRPQIIFNINPNQDKPAQYNGTTNTISFKSEFFIDFTYTKDELTHAFQKGIYGTMNSSYINYEFEQRLINDLSATVKNSYGCCTMFQSSGPDANSYLLWLLDMTGNAQMRPADIDRAKYFDFMNKFKASGLYPGYVNSNIQPLALDYLTQSCP